MVNALKALVWSLLLVTVVGFAPVANAADSELSVVKQGQPVQKENLEQMWERYILGDRTAFSNSEIHMIRDYITTDQYIEENVMQFTRTKLRAMRDLMRQSAQIDSPILK